MRGILTSKKYFFVYFFHYSFLSLSRCPIYPVRSSELSLLISTSIFHPCLSSFSYTYCIFYCFGTEHSWQGSDWVSVTRKEEREREEGLRWKSEDVDTSICIKSLFSLSLSRSFFISFPSQVTFPLLPWKAGCTCRTDVRMWEVIRLLSQESWHDS